MSYSIAYPKMKANANKNKLFLCGDIRLVKSMVLKLLYMHH